MSVEPKQKHGFLIVTGVLLLALTLTTILAISVVNNRRAQDIEQGYRVTLCILLTPAEERTATVVLECRNNPPTLEELPGVARDIQEG